MGKNLALDQGVCAAFLIDCLLLSSYLEYLEEQFLFLYVEVFEVAVFPFTPFVAGTQDTFKVFHKALLSARNS